MNRFVGMGRLTRDVDYRQSGDTTIARYTIAIDRRGKQEGADFIPCVAFGKSADFANKYFVKGTKIAVSGRISTGSYTNKDGVKVFTTEVVVDDQEFAESKSEAQPEQKPVTPDSFMSIPVEIEADELPFK